jgi:hypothetical protein
MTRWLPACSRRVLISLSIGTNAMAFRVHGVCERLQLALSFLMGPKRRSRYAIGHGQENWCA